jgi:hypothetical protein
MATRKRTTATKRKTATPAEEAAPAVDAGETAETGPVAAEAAAEAPVPEAEAAPGADVAAPPEASAPDEAAAGGPAQLSRKDLIDRVAEESGVKKRFVRPVIDSVLRQLGDTLSEGTTVNIKPLGKAWVQRTNDQANAEVLIVKLRRPKAQPPQPEDPLAEAAE